MNFCKTRPVVTKRPFLLLEVLIALALVALCMLPLVYPHFWMVKKEKSAVQMIKEDAKVGLVYIHLLEKLYMNELPWERLLDGLFYPVQMDGNDNEKITYSFSEVLSKEEEGTGNSHHLLKLQIRFEPNLPSDKPRNYEFEIYVERKIKLGT